jgi:glutamate formiminotransferase
MNKIVECVVNYSEGRNKEVIESITSVHLPQLVRL